MSINVYDSGNHEAFLGLVKVNPDVFHENKSVEGWYKLEARNPEEDHVSGEVHLEFSFQKTDKTKFGPEDFQILKLIGKGSVERYSPKQSLLIRNWQVPLAKYFRWSKRTLGVFTR